MATVSALEGKGERKGQGWVSYLEAMKTIIVMHILDSKSQPVI